MSAPDAKTIVITGVTRGLGRALARGFAALGHRVAGCGRDAAAIRALAGELGAPHVVMTADVTKAGEVAAFAEQALAALGAPDLLLNNAALINRSAPLWEVPEAEFARVIDVNLNGVHRVLRAFLPAMLARGAGMVVNFSSGWGRSAAPEVAPYCATKYGIEGLSAALAQELPTGLAVVALNPGIIDTEMLRSCFGDGAGDFPDPEEWARRAVPFLLGLSARDNGRALTVG